MAVIGTFELDIDTIVNGASTEENSDTKFDWKNGLCDALPELGSGYGANLDFEPVVVETEEKGCGCFASCDHNAETSEGCGDGHFHHMIDRFSVQIGEATEGEILVAGADPNQRIEVSTAPAGSEYLATGNLGFTLNDTGGAGVGTQARAAFDAAVELWQALLGDNVNISLDIGFQALSRGILGSTGSSTAVVSYSAFKTALTNDATSADDTTATTNLPAGNSLSFQSQDYGRNAVVTDNNGSANNNFLAIKTANAKALGITHDANGFEINPASDAQITFSNLFTWDFDPTDGIDAGSQDFVGVAFHEIGHALGFTSGVDLVDAHHGTSPGAGGGAVNLDGFAIFNSLDLFRYSAAGQLNFSFGGTPYFSLDGGTTSLGGFSTGRAQGDGQQASHWKDGLGLGIMDPTANPAGNVNNTTNLDLRAFDVIGWDILVDNIVQGTEFTQTNTGSALRDYIDGRAGNDTLNGFAGDDRLFGRTGNDIMSGGLGDDLINGGEGEDIILGNAGNDAINGGDGHDDIFAGSDDDIVHGNDGNDMINGQGGNDLLFGDAGNDDIFGSSGDDTLYGGNGDDFLRGSGNNDMIFGEDGHDVIQGGAGIDELYGGDGNDRLTGSRGSDRLHGGNGNDILNGGLDGNRDVMIFMNGDDQDRINSFEQDVDKLELDDALWLATHGNLTASEVVDTFATSNASGKIITLDFGGGDVLELQNGIAFDLATLEDDITII